jgi:hypothetical protein
MTIFMALPHALATGSDQPYSTRFGPRLNIWKRQPQKKAAPAQHNRMGKLLCAVNPRQTGLNGTVQSTWISINQGQPCAKQNLHTTSLTQYTEEHREPECPQLHMTVPNDAVSLRRPPRGCSNWSRCSGSSFAQGPAV